MKKNIHIAIDGPAGAGKSTIAKKLSEEININYLDTGAMYRAITYQILQLNIDMDNEEAIINEAEKTMIDFHNNSIFLNGKNVDKEIRTPLVSNHVSLVSKIPRIREILINKQREIACGKSVIMDGRDIGTVVLPEADYKFYLDASIEIRAQRRYDQLEQEVDIKKLQKEITARDVMDQTRKISPLKKADDAIVIDTSEMTIEQVLELMILVIQQGENK